jgi:hypothetical protein
MPTPGLSLVGFMDQQQAINHFLGVCIPANRAIPALIAEWDAAQARRGAPLLNAGNPDILPIPAAGQPYIQQLMQQQWVIDAIAQMPGAIFQLVEIDPLLAYQFSVDTDRSAHHCSALNSPTIAELLPICLPTTYPVEQINVSPQANSVLLKSPSLNVRMTAQGFFQAESKIGITFVTASTTRSIKGGNREERRPG